MASAAMEVVAAESLEARNTLQEPDRIRPAPADVRVQGQAVRFTLPPWSAAVVTLRR